MKFPTAILLGFNVLGGDWCQEERNLGILKPYTVYSNRGLGTTWWQVSHLLWVRAGAWVWLNCAPCTETWAGQYENVSYLHLHDDVALHDVARYSVAQHVVAQHAVAQHGIAQNGVAQHGVAQRGVAQNGVAQHGVAQHGMAEHGVAQHGIAEHGVAEHDVAEHGVAEHGVAPRGIAEHGVAEHGAAQRDEALLSNVGPCMFPSELIFV